MKICKCVLIFLLAGTTAYGQRSFYHPPDELRSGEEALADSLLLFAERALYDRFQEARTAAERAAEIGRQLNDAELEGYGHFFVAMTLMALGDWVNAQLEFHEAEDDFRVAGDSLAVALIYDRVGYAYRRQGYLSKSLSYHLLGLKRRQDFGDSKLNVGYSSAAVGGIYYALGEYGLARDHYYRAYQIRKSERDSMGMALSMRGLGKLNAQLENLDSAYYYLSRSLRIFEEMGSLTHIVSTYQELGRIERLAGRLEAAEDAFRKGLEVARQIGSFGIAALLDKELGKLARQRGKLAAAEEHLTSARRNLIATNNLQDLQEVNLLLSQWAEEKGDYESALSYYQQYGAAKDSLFSITSDRQLGELKVSFETEQKEARIQNLLEKQRYRTRERNGLLIGLSGMVLFIFALIYAFQQRARAFGRLLIEKNKTDSLLREKEELLDNLHTAQDQLVQSEKLASLGELTAGIAHEINNPVNFISSNTFALQMDFEELEPRLKELPSGTGESNIEFLTTEIKALIHGIRRGAERTKRIVSNLNTFSRQSDGRYEEADLHEGLDTSITILFNKFKNRIQIHKDYGDLPKVECQYLRINQVFLNIINNAIDAIEGEGEIFISTRVAGEQVVVKIRDTGTGMSEDAIRKIFEPFYTSKEVGKGTGLGLSISYGIIQQHRGSIEVHSELGKGSEFTVVLPLRRPAEEEDEEAIEKLGYPAE